MPHRERRSCTASAPPPLPSYEVCCFPQLCIVLLHNNIHRWRSGRTLRRLSGCWTAWLRRRRACPLWASARRVPARPGSFLCLASSQGRRSRWVAFLGYVLVWEWPVSDFTRVYIIALSVVLRKFICCWAFQYNLGTILSRRVTVVTRNQPSFVVGVVPRERLTLLGFIVMGIIVYTDFWRPPANPSALLWLV